MLLRAEAAQRERELIARESQVQRLRAALAMVKLAPGGGDGGGDGGGERDAAAHDACDAPGVGMPGASHALEPNRLCEACAQLLAREHAELDALARVAHALPCDNAPLTSAARALVLEHAAIEPRASQTRRDALGSAFVAFAVRVHAPEGSAWLVHRRFREFEALHLALARLGAAPVGASLPSKAVLQPRSPRVVEARTAQLNEYLAALVPQRCSAAAAAELPREAVHALRAFFEPGGNHISDHDAHVRVAPASARLLLLAHGVGRTQPARQKGEEERGREEGRVPAREEHWSAESA